MGIFTSIFKAREPTNRTSGSAYSFFLGSSSSGKRVNERTSMQMTAVYSCVRILSEAIAGLPIHVYRFNKDGGKEKAFDHPLYMLLHDEPNPEMTSFVFRETLMTHLLLWGNAYAQIIRNGKGEVVALYPLMPDRMQVERDEKGQLYYIYSHSSDEAKTMEGSNVILKPKDVLHIPGLGFDGLVGYSPIAMAKNAIGIAPYSLSSQGAPTYGTPVAWPGSVSLSMEPQGESNAFYADDTKYYVATSNDGYEVTLETALVPDWFTKDYLGQTVDTVGNLIEQNTDTPAYFAALFEFTGDQKAIRHCLFYCQASRPTQEAETKGESAEVKTEEIKFTAMAIPGTDIIKKKSTDDTTSAAYEAWYTTVAVPTFPTPGH